MTELIGTVSAVIALIETSIKIYNSAKSDFKLSKTFETVLRQLPVILQILTTCKENLEPRKNSIPENVCEALEETLYVCQTKAENLVKIFQKTVPGESDTRQQRYSKILQRLGKGNKVEELMLSLAEEVQLVINHDAVKSAADQSQNAELEDIMDEMKSLISRPGEDSSIMSFSNEGGAQINNVNRGSGKLYANNGGGRQYVGETQHFGKD
ncbi:hypothetical protein N7490_005445 [Penicillium lividum]|nr:hypothetical protein N7490_005445 [Penicillium lividum]